MTWRAKLARRAVRLAASDVLHVARHALKMLRRAQRGA